MPRDDCMQSPEVVVRDRDPTPEADSERDDSGERHRDQPRCRESDQASLVRLRRGAVDDQSELPSVIGRRTDVPVATGRSEQGAIPGGERIGAALLQAAGPVVDAGRQHAGPDARPCQQRFGVIGGVGHRPQACSQLSGLGLAGCPQLVDPEQRGTRANEDGDCDHRQHEPRGQPGIAAAGRPRVDGVRHGRRV